MADIAQNVMEMLDVEGDSSKHSSSDDSVNRHVDQQRANIEEVKFEIQNHVQD